MPSLKGSFHALNANAIFKGNNSEVKYYCASPLFANGLPIHNNE